MRCRSISGRIPEKPSSIPSTAPGCPPSSAPRMRTVVPPPKKVQGEKSFFSEDEVTLEMQPPYKVLIVDDSSLMRQLLAEILSSDPDLEVIGTAGDPFVAREKIKALNPDVLTLDIEMPRMDGLTFLEKLMRGHPMPVVMISSLTERGAEVTLRALSLGAIDYVSKPKLDVSSGTIEQTSEIIAKVKAAARVKVRGVTTPVTGPVELAAGCNFSATHKVVAV